MAENAKNKIKREYVSINKVWPNPNNTKIHPDSQIDQLVDSMIQFGFTKPLLVDENLMLLAGHGSYKAAVKARFEKVPILVMSHLSKRQQRALALADNKLAERSSWDLPNVAAELNFLLKEEYDIGSLGWSEQELDEILKIDIEHGVLPNITTKVSTVSGHERKVTKNKSIKDPKISLKLNFSEEDYQTVIIYLKSLGKDSIESALLSLCK